MALRKSHMARDSRAIFTCLSSDTKPTETTHPNLRVWDIAIETDTGNKYEYRGATAGWVNTDINGAALVAVNPASATRITDYTYNATTVVGFKVLTVGNGTITLSPLSGDTDIVITNAELVAMGINATLDWPCPLLDSISTTGTTSIMVLHA